MTRVSDLVRRGEVSIPDLVEGQLDRIGAYDPQLNSFSEVFADDARRRARMLHEEASRGYFRSALHGIPVAVKDLFWVEGTAPNAGGIVFRDERAPSNAAVVERLHEAGAIVVGKLRMSEAALAAHHPDLPTPVNPWDPEAWIGASSSGNAAATAAGLCFASIATDTGGSIRFPSAATGLTGLKPTWDAVSPQNSVPFAPSLDHVGTMARSAADCAAVFDTVKDTTYDAGAVTRDLRIGIDLSFMDACDAETSAVLAHAKEVLTELGARFIEVTLPPVDSMVDDWTPTCAVEAAVFHERTFRARNEEYGPQVRDLLEQGLALDAVEYERMRRRRETFRTDFSRAVDGVDALLMQVTGVSAPDQSYVTEIGVGEEWRRKIMMATCPINFVGAPALTLPGGLTTGGRPIGFQLVGRHHGESTLLDLGTRFQSMTDHHEHHPARFSTQPAAPERFQPIREGEH